MDTYLTVIVMRDDTIWEDIRYKVVWSQPELMLERVKKHLSKRFATSYPIKLYMRTDEEDVEVMEADPEVELYLYV